MALPGVKFDDGTGAFASNCFPVRTLVAQNDEGYGAWFVAHKAEEKRRFKAYVCSKPRTYEEIRGDRRRAEKDGTAIVPPAATDDTAQEDDNRVLDGFFLMKHCCVEDPTDLCSVNVSGQSLTDAKEEDFPLFDNVAYVNASENILNMECFHHFPIIRELELTLNGLRSLKIKPTDFPHLEMLDLSFNNLSSADVSALGLLPSLKVLHLTGNNLKTLPADLAKPHLDEQTFESVSRFKTLEILLLDDNSLCDVNAFAALAGLRRLKHLNLAKNGITSVPQLLLVEGRHVTQDSDAMKKRHRRRGNKSSRSSSRRSTPTGRRSAADTRRAAAEKRSSSTDLGSEGRVELGRPAVAPSGSATSGQETAQGATMATSVGDLAGPLSDVRLDDLHMSDLDPGLFESLGDLGGQTGAAAAATTDATQPETSQREGDAFERPGYTGEDPLPLPFPELRHLNLAHNKLSDEEYLLAVASWPKLAELVIHDNPLTTNNSGDPPILKRFLTDRLGIKIHRKKVPPLLKPHIEVPTKDDRKVVTRILPVPRCDVDKLLALEAPPTPKPATDGATTPQTPPGGRQGNPMDPSKPVPPIPGSPVLEEEEEEKQEGGDKGPAFFMTQVDEAPLSSSSRRQTPTSRSSAHSLNDASAPQAASPDRAKKRRPRRQRAPVPERYRGYEALLDGGPDDVDDDVPTQDLPGNVRSLQYTLSHPLVFRDTAPNLCTPQPPYRPYVKGAVAPPTQPRRLPGEQVDSVLGQLRDRPTVEERELHTAINDPTRRREGQHAKKLLAQLKATYTYTPPPSPQKLQRSRKSTPAAINTDKIKRKTPIKEPSVDEEEQEEIVANQKPSSSDQSEASSSSSGCSIPLLWERVGVSADDIGYYRDGLTDNEVELMGRGYERWRENW